ncbi:MULTISPECIES: acyl-CoA dehydrogenase family protein [unclassified Pseudonocardia]|uniref:acyl-CoA dehydrogenase family protein n=1 Tax=unclassified Pseudonocardia TaxID=2619320 RepID=UPI0001FFDE12|nr:acyl-CoA dehydrogenase family protein [Pseudonocardia sp. Ae707_Ps1]OLM08916.1 Butyryl-CoA dehydrogenase [Pseudonocardia sp. Ae707_Ps1]
MPTEIPPTVHPDHAELVGSVHEAVQGVIAACPRSLYLERARNKQHIPELWDAMVAADLLAIGVPEELGGAGGGLTGCTAVMEALARAGVPPLQYSLTTFSREAILRSGSTAQIDQHVVPTVEGRRRFCLGVTEPDSGTNSFASSTVARKCEDGYRIDGQKVFISAADESDHILLLARTATPGAPVGRRTGFGLFAVEMTLPGVSLRRLDIEWHAPEYQFEVFLDDVVVPESALIGTDGLGFDHLLACLNQERVTIAAWALGLGDYALTKAVDYARVRAPFGRPIGSHQAVAHPLALAKAEMEAARQVMYSAAAEYDSGRDAGTKANMAKLLASRAALGAVEAAIQTHGGSAFVYETDVITLWPMIRVLQIAPLNNESVLNHIAERVLGLPRS